MTGPPVSHVTFACLTVRSGIAPAVSPSPGVFWRKLLRPGCFQFWSHWLVRGALPDSSMLVAEYACWFQIVRVLTQRSSESASTRTPVAAAPAGCDARQTLPAADGPAIGSRHTNPSPPQSASCVQRQRPSTSVAFSRPQVVVDGQSDWSRHCTPSKIGSTAGHDTEQFVFDVLTIYALKSASTSALTGFSYQVHEVR